MYEFSMEPLKIAYRGGGWTFAALSEATGLSTAGLCDMFNGKYPPRVDRLVLICTALGVHPNRLFSRIEKNK